MELLPAIDLRAGRVVRLRQGDDERRTVYEWDPHGLLARFADSGARCVHVVDLDAALGGSRQEALLESLARQAGALRLQLGGGLRDRDAVEWALGSGFDRAVVTSLLVRDFALFAELAERHPGRLVAALDVRDGALRLEGWRERAALSLDALCARLRSLPLAALLVTDIERDGMLGEPNIELAAALARRAATPALVSGGVRTVEHLRAAARTEGIAGAIVGRALYDGELDLAAALAACRPPSQPGEGA